MKMLPVGAELFHVDRRTDKQTNMTRLLVAFLNFANASQNGVDSKLTTHLKLCDYLLHL
jgi:hypothetical protein